MVVAVPTKNRLALVLSLDLVGCPWLLSGLGNDAGNTLLDGRFRVGGCLERQSTLSTVILTDMVLLMLWGRYQLSLDDDGIKSCCWA